MIGTNAPWVSQFPVLGARTTSPCASPHRCYPGMRRGLGATGRERAVALYGPGPSARTMIDCFASAQRFHAARATRR